MESVKNSTSEILGWVNLYKKRYIIVKHNNNFYRGEYIKDIILEQKTQQFPLINGGYEYPLLHKITVESFNNTQSFSSHRDDDRNIKLYNDLIKIKQKTIEAGQIYY